MFCYIPPQRKFQVTTVLTNYTGVDQIEFCPERQTLKVLCKDGGFYEFKFKEYKEKECLDRLRRCLNILFDRLDYPFLKEIAESSGLGCTSASTYSRPEFFVIGVDRVPSIDVAYQTYYNYEPASSDTENTSGAEEEV